MSLIILVRLLRGSMESYWVQVDTDILRGFSKGYRTRADVFNQAGKSIQYAILSIIENMPEYDGRLQQAARADALDFHNQAMQFSAGFSDDSDLLLKTAEAFENVDGKTVRIFEECRGTISSACYTDLQGASDTETSTYKYTITNSDGSITSITVVRSTKSDGSVSEITTLTTIWTLDAFAAYRWNTEESNFSNALSGTFISIVTGGAGVPACLSTSIGILSGWVMAAIPYDKYAGGDTVTNTVTIVTEYQPDGSPSSQEITNTTEITDKDGEQKFSDTTGIDPTGYPKSGTPPVKKDG